jgi:hypothetical protein
MIWQDGPRITVQYRHHFANTEPIHIGLSGPAGVVWVPAFRDMDGDQPVIWAEFPQIPTPAVVLVRDGRGERRTGVLR